MTNALNSQEAAEVVLQPTDQKTRVSQEAAEVVLQPTDMAARVSQVMYEVAYAINSSARVSQVVIEFARPAQESRWMMGVWR